MFILMDEFFEKRYRFEGSSVKRYIFAFVLLLIIAVVILTQVRIPFTEEVKDLGSFLWISQEAKPVQLEILNETQYVSIEQVDNRLVLEDDEWKAEVYICTSLETRQRVNVTYYEDGKPLYWRIELQVDGFFIQFDIDYLNKKTNEKTHMRRYLVSEYVEGLDVKDYTAAAEETEEIAPPVSDYAVGRIRIVNRETTVTDRKFKHDPFEDVYEEEIDVEILFDIRCTAVTETRIILMDYLNEITGSPYNTMMLIIAVMGLLLGFVKWIRPHYRKHIRVEAFSFFALLFWLESTKFINLDGNKNP